MDFEVSPPPTIGSKWKSYQGTRWVYDGPASNPDGSPKLFNGDNVTRLHKVTCVEATPGTGSYQAGNSIDVLPNWFGGSAELDLSIGWNVSPPPAIGSRWRSYSGTRWVYDGPANNPDGSPKLFNGDNLTRMQKATCVEPTPGGGSYQVGDSIETLPNWFGGSAQLDLSVPFGVSPPPVIGSKWRSGDGARWAYNGPASNADGSPKLFNGDNLSRLHQVTCVEPTPGGSGHQVSDSIDVLPNWFGHSAQLDISIDFGVSPPPTIGSKWRSYQGTRWVYDGPASNPDGSPKLFNGDNVTRLQKMTCIEAAPGGGGYQVGHSIDVLPNWLGGSAVPDPDPVP